MYAWLWRSLPGHWTIRLFICLVLIAAVVYLLMQFVFPEIAPFMPFNNATVGDSGESG